MVWTLFFPLIELRPSISECMCSRCHICRTHACSDMNSKQYNLKGGHVAHKQTCSGEVVARGFAQTNRCSCSCSSIHFRKAAIGTRTDLPKRMTGSPFRFAIKE